MTRREQPVLDQIDPDGSSSLGVVAALAGVSRNAALVAVTSGRLPATWIDRGWFVRGTELSAWIARERAWGVSDR